MHFHGDDHAWGAIHPPNMAANDLGAAQSGHSHDAAPAQSVNAEVKSGQVPAASGGPAAPAGALGMLITGCLGLLAGLGLATAGRGAAARMRQAACPH